MIPKIPHGQCWLYCDGPDGSVVLLANYDGRTGFVTLFDDGSTSYPLVDGKYVHKWEVFDAEPVVRPPPKSRPE